VPSLNSSSPLLRAFGFTLIRIVFIVCEPAVDCIRSRRCASGSSAQRAPPARRYDTAPRERESQSESVVQLSETCANLL
jgi:hypothetical protein